MVTFPTKLSITHKKSVQEHMERLNIAFEMRSREFNLSGNKDWKDDFQGNKKIKFQCLSWWRWNGGREGARGERVAHGLLVAEANVTSPGLSLYELPVGSIAGPRKEPTPFSICTTSTHRLALCVPVMHKGSTGHLTEYRTGEEAGFGLGKGLWAI